MANPTPAEIEAGLDEIITKMTGNTSQIASLKLFIQGLKDQVAASGIPQSAVEKVHTILDIASAQAQELVEAQNAGTPAADVQVQ
jgi:hypothetical protein